MKRFRETVSEDNKVSTALLDVFLSLASLAAATTLSTGNRADLYSGHDFWMWVQRAPSLPGTTAGVKGPESRATAAYRDAARVQSRHVLRASAPSSLRHVPFILHI